MTAAGRGQGGGMAASRWRVDSGQSGAAAGRGGNCTMLIACGGYEPGVCSMLYLVICQLQT